MRAINDLLAWDWARKLLWYRSDPTLRYSVPADFDAVAKVLHVIDEDLSVEDRAQTWHEYDRPGLLVRLLKRTYYRMRRLLGLTMTGRHALREVMLKSVLVGGAPAGDYPSKRVHWCDLASRYGVPFEAGIDAEWFRPAFSTGSWPRYLVGPEDGSLSQNEFAELTRILRTRTSSTEIFALYDLLANRNRGDVVFSGKMDELDGLRTAPERCGTTPTLWWPADKAWCVYTDWDSTYTLVASSRATIDDVLASDVLDSVEVDRDTDPRPPFKREQPTRR